MSNSLAYHVVVHALEGRAGWTPMARFASAVSHVIQGHLPYQRYHAAGVARSPKGSAPGVIERLVNDFLATDINPSYLLLSSFRREADVFVAFNAYNQSANLGVQTSLGGQGAGNVARGAARASRVAASDPDSCRHGTLAIIDTMLATTRANAAAPDGAPKRSLGALALLLGIESSTAAEVAFVFENEGHFPIGQLAGRLGCHQRTLERRLREVGMTAEALRQAARLVRAAHRLPSADSLTMIAADEGFSDLAHMTRAFQAAAGMPPSLIRKLGKGQN
ncbi:helix-turn-helix domain-containing protein [Janthinobacterium sp. SUN100]|uniref:helix-turn-helix domain-containing protein n=1 Tax=Janthinobacterium sp. SUN100 TaxID=3004101 RepID=UPI0025B0A783|nr:helix-turn-helix domain-containing protein [Janthinobacterium sp. SUN100]MDN2703137.1 helix-turn-helix domain-containing protein [Janthinobacterium sp. SUN100]